MANDNKTVQHITRTIALPALLVISLLTARLVMYSKTGKTNLRLSAPIELNRSGLSVSMPSGNGWQCKEKWTFKNNFFYVLSIFGSGLKDTSYVQCRYLLAPDEKTPREQLSSDFPRIKLIVTGQLTENNLIVNWASTNTDSGGEIILGVCELADGRQLEIEILQGASEQNPAKDIFEKIAKSIRFSDNGLLHAGTRLISNIRAQGLDIAAGDSNKMPSSMFTIADSYNKTIGFAMDAMVFVKKETNITINAADYYYLRGTVPNVQVGFFRGSIDLRQFVWQEEISSRTDKKGTKMTADSGKLNIRRLRTGSLFDRRSRSDTDEYELGETAVPNIVLEPILTNALDSNEQAFIIDIISSDGNVIPVYLEKSPPPGDQMYSNSIRLEWLDGHGYWQQNYYKDSKIPIKIVLKQESIYTFNRTDANEIAAIFPEQADLVNGKIQLLDGDGL
jgi:hypothetical protein